MSEPSESHPASAQPARPKLNHLFLRRVGLPIWLLAMVSVVVLVSVLGSLTGLGSEHARAEKLAQQVRTLKHQVPSDSPDSSSSGLAASDDTTAADSSSSFAYDKDFMYITLKTTRKHCFGSAGCNVTVEPNLGMLDTSTVPADATGTVTYEITGGSDGAVVDTIDLTGTKYDVSSTLVQTANSSVKLKVKITDVQTY